MLTTGQRIRKLREEHNYTMERLAEIIGCDTTAIFYWESDRSLPRAENLLLLSRALDISVVELLTGRRENDGQ